MLAMYNAVTGDMRYKGAAWQSLNFAMSEFFHRRERRRPGVRLRERQRPKKFK